MLQGTSSSSAEHRHVCHCGRAFIRKEHLRRHQATHGAPSYTCHLCRRAFTRNDLLRRHVSRHDTATTHGARRGRACDACHANKTRCTGGPQCSLCSKRGVSCTFSNEARTAEVDEPTSDARGVNPGSILDLNSNTAPSLNISSFPVTDTVPRSKTNAKITDGSQSSTEFLQTLTIQVAKYTTSEDESKQAYMNLTPQEAIRIIHDRFVKGPAQTSRVAEAMATDELRDSIKSCAKTFFDRFHLRWPIIHAVAFYETDQSLLVVASVTLVGAWLEGDETTKGLSESTHNELMSIFFQVLCKPETISRTNRWPIELLQAILINIIFGIYCSKDDILTRVIMLRSIFITILREAGMFDSQIAKYQERTHFPGTFPPFVMATCQRRNRFVPHLPPQSEPKWEKNSQLLNGLQRLVSCLYRVDFYLSVLRNQPPSLHLEQLDVALPCTFALWNSYGLHVFYKRQPDEPIDRADCVMLNLQDHQRNPADQASLLPQQIIVEDIQLGLCGLYPSIWKYAQAHRMRNKKTMHTGNDDIQKSLTVQLNHWKRKLDEISTMCKIQSQNPDLEYTELPICAYRGEEDTQDVTWKAKAFQRVSSLICDVELLYHLLILHIYGRGHVVVHQPFTGLAKKTSNEFFLEWSDSKDARKAISHAMTVLKIVELNTNTATSVRPLDPLAHIAVWTGLDIVRKVLGRRFLSCTCSSNMPQVSLSGGADVFGSWIETGDPILVDGVPLCGCTMNAWEGRFEMALLRTQTAFP